MRFIDLTNKQYGRFFVLKKSEKIAKAHDKYWVCKCSCGTIKDVLGGALKNGTTKSCGCLRRDFGTWNRGLKGEISHVYRGYKGIPRQFYTELKSNANRRKIEFNLTIEYLWNLLEKQNFKCKISGVFIRMPEKYEASFANLASLDRIDSSKGYIEGNVQWVDRRINFMKHRMSDNEFIEVCEEVVKYQKEIKDQLNA